MAISKTIKDDKADLVIIGDFTFPDHVEFQEILMSTLAKPIKLMNIDLSRIQLMDSAGLGMLMVAGKECAARQVDFTLSKPQGIVKSMLEATGCYERLTIID